MSAPLLLYRTPGGAVLGCEGGFFGLIETWDGLVNHPRLADHLRGVAARGRRMETLAEPLLAPVGGQEVWAAGVTYERSRQARAGESHQTGGSAFYDRVYEAERPELFLKAAGWRVKGPGEPVRVRRDARWSVPEPELALYVNERGEIVGWTIGNDVSSRDIEAENPLYLPQAKIYDGSCALGPAVLVAEGPLPPQTAIELRVLRAGAVAFEGGTTLARMRRTPEDLVRYLFRETSFPLGCVLLTGTGIVPPGDFTLQVGDVVEIRVPPIGTLRNPVSF